MLRFRGVPPCPPSETALGRASVSRASSERCSSWHSVTAVLVTVRLSADRRQPLVRPRPETSPDRGRCRDAGSPDVSRDPPRLADSVSSIARPRSRRSWPSRRSSRSSGRPQRWPQGRAGRPRGPRGRPTQGQDRHRSTSGSARSTSWAASTPPRVATGSNFPPASVRSAERGRRDRQPRRRDPRHPGAPERPARRTAVPHRLRRVPRATRGDRPRPTTRSSTTTAGSSSSSGSSFTIPFMGRPRPQPILKLQVRMPPAASSTSSTPTPPRTTASTSPSGGRARTPWSRRQRAQGVRAAGAGHRRHERPRGVLLQRRARRPG